MIPPVRGVIALILASALAYRGVKKKSLNKSGASAAFLVGFVAFATSYRFGVTLILFYQSSSSLTKYKGELKRKLESDYQEGGQRDYVQVLSCSAIATVIAIIFLVFEGEDAAVNWSSDPRRSFLLCSYLGHYACCNGDTWASELGVLNKSLPRLVTAPWRRVPAGTNGGMSEVGTLASLVAGLFIGAGFAGAGWLWVVGDGEGGFGAGWQWGFVWLGALGGLGGSLLDSLLGATLQATWYDKDRKLVVPHHSPLLASTTAGTKKSSNIVLVCGWDILTGEQVNALSVAATTLLCGAAGRFFF